MKTAAFVIMAASWLSLVVIMAKIAVITIQPETGLLNPAIHIDLPSSARIFPLGSLVMALFSTYIYVIVGWMQQRLNRMQSLLPATSWSDEIRQPWEVKLLKDAIRLGDVDEVRQLAGEAALAFKDERFLTPYELAELYGNEEVLTVLKAAYRRQINSRVSQRNSEPPSRFAVGRGTAPR